MTALPVFVSLYIGTINLELVESQAKLPIVKLVETPPVAIVISDWLFPVLHILPFGLYPKGMTFVNLPDMSCFE